MGGRSETYTHGHHESVLRSHRWRTAENSAAYLLPHLAPGHRPARRRLRTRDDHRSTSPAPWRRAGSSASTRVEEPLVAARAEAAAAGVANVTYAVGDAYALDFDDGTFDVVHAHQVLQHLADPVAALREMRRVCRPGGLVGGPRQRLRARSPGIPPTPTLDRWLELYQAVARRNGGEPDAGRRLLAWAQRGRVRGRHAVGLDAGASRRPTTAPGGAASWADRVTGSAFADARRRRAASPTAAELARIADAWRRWAAQPDGWFIVPCGEVLCRAG